MVTALILLVEFLAAFYVVRTALKWTLEAMGFKPRGWALNLAAIWAALKWVFRSVPKDA